MIDATPILSGLAAVAWVMLFRSEADANLSHGELMIALLITISVVSANLLMAEDGELFLWGWALCSGSGGCPVEPADLPLANASAVGICVGPNE